MSDLVFYDYWRSSSAYRVRIALNLKGVAARRVSVDLVGGEQGEAAYRAVNPQGLVPALAVDGQVISQSLAIICWLDSRYPAPPLLPADPMARAQALAQALIIAADTQPLQNSRVQHYLRHSLGADKDQIAKWNQHWIGEGLAALEAQAPAAGLFGGNVPNVVDIYLVPQLYNARRYDLPLDRFPALARIDAALQQIDAFALAAPEAVK